MTIVHKLSRGVVDLQLPGMGDKLDELRESISEYLSDEIELVQTNKSASLRISVPVVEKTMLFKDQEQNVAQGLVAARRLLGVGEQMIG